MIFAACISATLSAQTTHFRWNTEKFTLLFIKFNANKFKNKTLNTFISTFFFPSFYSIYTYQEFHFDADRERAFLFVNYYSWTRNLRSDLSLENTLPFIPNIIPNDSRITGRNEFYFFMPPFTSWFICRIQTIWFKVKVESAKVIQSKILWPHPTLQFGNIELVKKNRKIEKKENK